MDSEKPSQDEHSSGLFLTEKERTTVEKFSRQLSSSKSRYITPGRLYVEIETSREEKEILSKVIQAFKVREKTATSDDIDQNDNSRSGSDVCGNEQDGPLGRFGKRLVSFNRNEWRESLPEQRSYNRNSLDSSYLNPGRLYVTEEEMQIITTISHYDRNEQTEPHAVDETSDWSGEGNVAQRKKAQNSGERRLYNGQCFGEENKGLSLEEIEFKSDANSDCEFQAVRVAKFEPLSSIPKTGHDNLSFEHENETMLNPRLPTNARVTYIGSEETVRIDLVKPEPKVTHVKQERDGKIIDLTSGPAKENASTSARALKRFRKAAEKVKAVTKEIRPKKVPEEDFAIWKDRGACGWFGLLATLGGILAFFADIALDLKVSADHFGNQDYWWCGLTASLVIIPSMVVNLVSLFWYLEDEEVTHQEPETGWKKIYLIHFCQLGLAERSWRLVKKGYRILKKKDTKLYDYKLFISRNLDLAMLQMFLAFTEDAPQLVLQLYVLVRKRLLKTESLSEIWTIISICFSFISYSRALVNYIMCLRDSKRHKGRLRWYGYLSMWLWRAFMIISRILVLVFFSSAFRGWFFLVFAIHYVLVFLLLGRHKVSFFLGHTYKQYFFLAIVAYIHIFCFFSLEGVRTIPWACKYYLMTFAENMILTLLWYFNSTKHLNYKLELAGLIVVFLFYLAGLAIMCVYYKYLHPRFRHPKLEKLMSWTGLGSEESAAIDKERKTEFEDIKEEPRIVQQWELWI